MTRLPLYSLGRWIGLGCPRSVSGWLADRVADWHWRLSAKDRAAVQANLTQILNRPMTPDAPEVRDVFHHLAWYLLEFVTAPRLAESLDTIPGREALRRSLRPGQGTIILSAHLGNWELGAILMRRMGFPFDVVALPHRDRPVNRFFDRQRARCGVEVVPLSPRATSRCLSLLRQGHLLGMLADRDFGDTGMTVSFFGEQIVVPRGLAVLSLRSQAPVLPVFVIREGPWRFRVHIEPPIMPPRATGNAERVRILTQQYLAVLERWIRRFPTQWLMFRPLAESQPTRISTALSHEPAQPWATRRL